MKTNTDNKPDVILKSSPREGTTLVEFNSAKAKRLAKKDGHGDSIEIMQGEEIKIVTWCISHAMRVENKTSEPIRILSKVEDHSQIKAPK